MYEHLSKVLMEASRENSGNSILSISHSQGLAELLSIKNPKITPANFPQYNTLDLPFKDNEFDWVVSDQVLEHIEGNPQKAIDESCRVLKPGGVAVITTCFINTIHGCPKDFWRFTPEALQLLCKEFTEIIDMGGWGNPYIWLLIWLGMRHFPTPHAKWHPLHILATIKKRSCPIVTWVVAKK